MARAGGIDAPQESDFGSLEVPEPLLPHLVRGLLDGDGSIINEVYRADTGRRDDYYWEYLITSFKSASRPHLEWLRSRLHATTGQTGYLSQLNINLKKPLPNRHPFFELRYGKRGSLVLLPLLYPAAGPCLERKRAKWIRYAQHHGLIG